MDAAEPKLAESNKLTVILSEVYKILDQIDGEVGVTPRQEKAVDGGQTPTTDELQSKVSTLLSMAKELSNKSRGILNHIRDIKKMI